MVRPVNTNPGALTFADNVGADTDKFNRTRSRGVDPSPVTFHPPPGWTDEMYIEAGSRIKTLLNVAPVALNLDSIEVKSKKHQSAKSLEAKNRQPTPLFDVPIQEKTQIKAASDYAISKYSGMLTAYPERIDRQISQLIPLSTNGVMHWSSKSIEELSKLTVTVSKLARDFAQANGSELSTDVLNTITQSSDNSFFSRFSKPTKNVTTFIPRLKVLQTQMEQWIPHCEQLISAVIKTQQELTIKFVSLISVIDTVGPISDNSLDIACANRRILCQQSIQQSEMLVIQLKQLAVEMVDISGRVEQLVQITIPAFLNATSTS